MRYLLQKSFISEIPARQQYLYDTMHLWVLPKESTDDSFIILEGLASTLDICFIVGHNFFVKKLLESTSIPEHTIVAITCDGQVNFKNLKLNNKELYISRQDHRKLSPLYRGKEYGFDFDLTESEILFYSNCKTLSIISSIKKSFTKLY